LYRLHIIEKILERENNSSNVTALTKNISD
jgi:hypothetical protein